MVLWLSESSVAYNNLHRNIFDTCKNHPYKMFSRFLNSMFQSAENHIQYISNKIHATIDSKLMTKIRLESVFHNQHKCEEM